LYDIKVLRFLENLKGMREMNKILTFFAITLLLIVPCTASPIKVLVPNDMGTYSEEAIQFFDPIFKKMGYEPEYVPEDIALYYLNRFEKEYDVILCTHPDSLLSNHGQFQFTESYDSIEIHKMQIFCYETLGGHYNKPGLKNVINSTSHSYNSYFLHLENHTIQTNNLNDLVPLTIINPNACEVPEFGAIINFIGPKVAIDSMRKRIETNVTSVCKNTFIKRGYRYDYKPVDYWPDSYYYERSVEIASDKVVDNLPLVVAVNKNSPVSVFKINRGIDSGIKEGRLSQIKESLSPKAPTPSSNCNCEDTPKRDSNLGKTSSLISFKKYFLNIFIP
jgi:hypothetical protein